MISLHPRYLIDEVQNTKSVILPLSEWEGVLEELEELDDIRAYDEAKSGPQDSLPFGQAVREIREEYDT